MTVWVLTCVGTSGIPEPSILKVLGSEPVYDELRVVVDEFAGTEDAHKCTVELLKSGVTDLVHVLLFLDERTVE